MNSKFVSVLSIVNFLLIISVILWLAMKGDHSFASLEQALEDLTEKNPHFLVSLLNKSANTFAKVEEKNIEDHAFERRNELLQAGFCVKKGNDESLVIFADMADINSLTYLKNVQKVLSKLSCSVYIIPITIFGEKSTQQGICITAAAAQDPQKAFSLALTFDPLEGAKNNSEKTIKALGLDFKKLTQECQNEKRKEDILAKTQLAETLGGSVLSIFLIKRNEAYILPPAEAEDLSKLIENPKLMLAD